MNPLHQEPSLTISQEEQQNYYMVHTIENNKGKIMQTPCVTIFLTANHALGTPLSRCLLGKMDEHKDDLPEMQINFASYLIFIINNKITSL